MIGVMLFYSFLDVRIQFRRTYLRVLPITLFLSAIAVPGFVYYVLSIGFTDHYRTGLLLIACAPTGITPLVLCQYLKGGNYPLVLGNFLFLNFGSIVYIPIILKFVLSDTIRFEISPLELLGQMSLLVVLPYILSQITVHLFNQRWLLRHKFISTGSTLVLLFCVIMISIGKTADQLEWNAEYLRLATLILAVFLIHGGLGYAIGWAWDNAELKTTLPMICSSRNMQLVFAIAVLNFPPLTYVPIIMGVFFHHLTNALWLWILGKGQPIGRPA
jgi:predicted Na+-dependent transporter